MIIDFEQLPEVRDIHSRERIVFRGGCYDIFHEGHVKGLEYARSLGDVLVVGVRPDKRVAERKGSERPIRDALARLAVVDAIRHVDYSFLMPDGNEEIGPSSLRVVHALRPDVFVGSSPHGHPNDEIIESLGTEIKVDMNAPLSSTTGIIHKILRAYGGTNEATA